VQCTGDVTVATDLGVPRSTARGWLDVTELTEPELRQEVVKLRRRVGKAHGTAPARAGSAKPPGFAQRSASVGGTRQAANPAGRDRAPEHVP